MIKQWTDFTIQKNHRVSLLVALLTPAVSLAFWIVFRVIFSRLEVITASPLQAGISIIAPIILFGLFVWLLTVAILVIPNIRIRYLVYLAIAVLYVPAHWSGLGSACMSIIGIFVTQVLYDWLYRKDLENQKKPSYGKTVITAGTTPIIIFSITISTFYAPLYAHNIARHLSIHNPVLIADASQLGYFFVLQTFLVVSTLISAILVFITTRLLINPRWHIELNY